MTEQEEDERKRQVWGECAPACCNGKCTFFGFLVVECTNCGWDDGYTGYCAGDSEFKK